MTKKQLETQLAAMKNSALPHPMATVAFRRIYMDIAGNVDAQLEVSAKAAGKTKKAFVEGLIVAAVAESEDQRKGQKGGK